MRRTVLFLGLCLLCLPLLCACTATGNPLLRSEATPVPGVPLTLHAATAADGNASQYQATLYFRFMDTAYLAAEARVLTVQKEESNEMAVLRALLEGPSAEKTELRRLLRDDITIESISDSSGMISIAFNNAFLQNGDASQDDAETALSRQLTVQSIVNTITENFAYASVQILISEPKAARADTRLDRSYFGSGQTGPCDPFKRDESVLLTSYNTASLLLKAWQERDYATLYQFTASYTDGGTRPVYSDFLAQIDASHALTDYSLSAGSVAEDGQHATHAVSLSTLWEGREESIPSYPLRLCRENGIWKITYSSLLRMMLP